jgi:hypothetical protein
VFAAELLYDRAEFERIADALVRCVAPHGTIWIADAQRVGTDQFYDALAQRGFAIREVCACDVREESTPVRVRLVALGRDPRPRMSGGGGGDSLGSTSAAARRT